MRRKLRMAYNAYIWVDQICIDQSNTVERNAQVSLMGQIYARARNVIAWLGRHDRDAEDAIGYIKRRNLSRGPRSFKTWKSERRWALDALGANPYWSRLWVVQEFVLAPRITIMCNSSYVQWSQLDLYRGAYYRTPLDGSILSHIFFCRDTVHNRRRSMLDTLISFCQNECEDPRDKVYALLGLLPPEVLVDMRPNYSVDVEDVFKDAVRCVIRSEVKKTDLVTLQGPNMDRPKPNLAALHRLCDEMGLMAVESTTSLSHNHSVLDEWIREIWNAEREEQLMLLRFLDRNARQARAANVRDHHASTFVHVGSGSDWYSR